MASRLFIGFVLLVSLAYPAYSTPRLDNESWREVVQRQNATDSDLMAALRSDDAKLQARALVTLTKVITPSALEILIDISQKILAENTKDFCFAIGQMVLNKDTENNQAIDPDQVNSALDILANLIQNNKNKAHCFEAFAKWAPRARDNQMEELFEGIDKDTLSGSDFSRTLVAFYFHRILTYDEKNPTDRYWFSLKLKSYIRSLNLMEHSSPLVREAFARIIYLFNDELADQEAAQLLKDPDSQVRLMATNILKLRKSKDTDALVSALNDDDYKVVISAIDLLVGLNKTKLLESFKPLLSHPRHQVRRAMLSALSSSLSATEIQTFLKDQSKTVRQFAVSEYLREAPDKWTQAQQWLASQDDAAKKGVIDASASLDTNKIKALEIALSDEEMYIRIYAIDHITNNNMVELYPRVLKFLSADTFDERYYAAVALVKMESSIAKRDLVLSTYSHSLQSQFWHVRDVLVDGLILSPTKEDNQLLVQMLAVEKNWRLANKIGSAINKFGFGEYKEQSPEWADSEGYRFLVTERRPQIEIETTKGKMVFELYNDLAPIHVSEVLWGIEQGLWSQNYFHRVVDNFVVQSSRSLTTSSVASDGLRAEITDQVQVRGTLAAPRSSYLHSSSGFGFYVNLTTNYNLNINYTVFGKIVSGESVLDELEIGDSVLSARRLK